MVRKVRAKARVVVMPGVVRKIRIALLTTFPLMSILIVSCSNTSDADLKEENDRLRMELEAVEKSFPDVGSDNTTATPPSTRDIALRNYWEKVRFVLGEAAFASDEINQQEALGQDYLPLVLTIFELLDSLPTPEGIPTPIPVSEFKTIWSTIELSYKRLPYGFGEGLDYCLALVGKTLNEVGEALFGQTKIEEEECYFRLLPQHKVELSLKLSRLNIWLREMSNQFQ